MLRDIAPIIEHAPIGEKLFRLKIKSPGISANWIPGQFVQFLPPTEGDRPLMLRRPISILSSHDDIVEFVYRVEGPGTSLMSTLKPGDTIDTIGPLGNGFDSIPDSDGKHILVGGGVGAPPMIALARYLQKMGKDVCLYQGARNQGDLILHGEMVKEKICYFASTEDGSIGHKGLIVDILPEPSEQIAAAYACGPTGMMKAVLKWRGESEIPYYVSIENKMGCGVGVCLGCSLSTVSGYYVRVCKIGPVFNADELEWEKIR